MATPEPNNPFRRKPSDPASGGGSKDESHLDPTDLVKTGPSTYAPRGPVTKLDILEPSPEQSIDNERFI